YKLQNNMSNKIHNALTKDAFMHQVELRNPGEKEFLEAVQEVVDSIWDLLQEQPQYLNAKILERITEPERVVMFRVPWTDDNGEVQVNRGYRVELIQLLALIKEGCGFIPL